MRQLDQMLGAVGDGDQLLTGQLEVDAERIAAIFEDFRRQHVALARCAADLPQDVIQGDAGDDDAPAPVMDQRRCPRFRRCRRCRFRRAATLTAPMPAPGLAFVVPGLFAERVAISLARRIHDVADVVLPGLPGGRFQLGGLLGGRGGHHHQEDYQRRRQVDESSCL